MKHVRTSRWALMAAILLSSLGARAADFDAISNVRGVEPSAISAVCNRCETLESDAIEFANGNTFVKYKSDPGSRNVIVRIPEQMSADVFMEALLRVRTLETLGAARIGIEVIGNAENLRVVKSDGTPLALPIANFLWTAGATRIFDGPGDGKDLSAFARELRAPGSPTGVTVIYPGNHPQLAASLAQSTGFPTTSLVASPAGKTVLVLAAPSAPVNESLLQTLADIETITSRGGRAHLITPYLPYARSDKMDQEGITTGGRLLMDLVQAVGTRSLTYARAHAPQSAGFSRIPQRQAMSYETMLPQMRAEGVDLVIAPDAGAQKDATKFADMLGVPVAVINKQREGNSIRMRGMTLPNGLTSLEGKRVLILDDETASGSTLRDAAAQARALGATTVLAAVTHLAGDAGAALRSDDITRMYVTDSIPVSQQLIEANPKLRVLSLASEIIAQLRRGILAPVFSCKRIFGL